MGGGAFQYQALKVVVVGAFQYQALKVRAGHGWAVRIECGVVGAVLDARWWGAALVEGRGSGPRGGRWGRGQEVVGAQGVAAERWTLSLPDSAWAGCGAPLNVGLP